MKHDSSELCDSFAHQNKLTLEHNENNFSETNSSSFAALFHCNLDRTVADFLLRVVIKSN